MTRIRSSLTYSNVVATLALALALSGGVAYAASTLGKNAVKSKNIAAHAVKARNLAANAVTTAKVKKAAITGGKVKGGALTRKNLAKGTLPGLQVVNAGSSSVPGLTTEPNGGTPVALSGTTTFTPAAGKSYELLTELTGTPTPAGAEPCFPFVTVLVNGVPMAGAGIFKSNGGTPPFNNEPVGSSSVPVGLQEAGEPQTITALSFGDSNCSAATTGSLRITVVEFG